jgi:hypothetical protein
MSSEDGEVYIMREGDEGEWVSPTPAREAIEAAVVESSDLDDGDLEGLDEYVDTEDLRGVLEGDDGELSFEIEDVTVTVDADGDIDVK